MVIIDTRPSTYFQMSGTGIGLDVLINGKPQGYMWKVEDDNEWNVSINGAPEGVLEFNMIGSEEEVLAELAHRAEPYYSTNPIGTDDAKRLEDKDTKDA